MPITCTCIVCIVALISDGDKNVFTGQPTALWKAQRRLLHEALRLAFFTQNPVHMQYLLYNV